MQTFPEKEVNKIEQQLLHGLSLSSVMNQEKILFKFKIKSASYDNMKIVECFKLLALKFLPGFPRSFCVMNLLLDIAAASLLGET